MVRTVNAQLRYYMHISDPDSLSDEDWAMRFKEIEWIRKTGGGRLTVCERDYTNNGSDG